jgi:WD40 repeat protein
MPTLVLTSVLVLIAETNCLIEQLASTQFAERRAASRRLEQIGVPALEALQQAMKVRDPEVCRRAEEVFRTIVRPRPMALLRGHTGAVTGLAFSPDGKLLASSSEDGTVCLWDVSAGSLRGICRGHDRAVRGVAFCPQGFTLASAGDEGNVRFCNAATQRQVGELSWYGHGIRSLVIAPDGDRLATAGEAGVLVWETRTGRLQATFKYPEPGLFHQVMRRLFLTTVFSPDGRRLAASGMSVGLGLWYVPTQKHIATLSTSGSTVLALAYQPSGELLAAADADTDPRLQDPGSSKVSGKVVLLDMVTGEERTVLEGHAGAVYALVFSPDSRLLYAAGQDGIIKVWDVATGKEWTGPVEHGRQVWALALSPDGKILASAGTDRAIRLWDFSRLAWRKQVMPTQPQCED